MTCARRWTKGSSSAKCSWSGSPAGRAATSAARTWSRGAERAGVMTVTTVKVLLVDDNPMVLGLIQQVLTPMAEVRAVSNSADVLLVAIDEPPDLLITDYRMPGMDGRVLAEKLHARAATARVPVVILAARADVSEQLKPVQDVFEDILEKPFFARELGSRLKRVIDKIALE